MVAYEMKTWHGVPSMLSFMPAGHSKAAKKREHFQDVKRRRTHCDIQECGYSLLCNFLYGLLSQLSWCLLIQAGSRFTHRSLRLLVAHLSVTRVSFWFIVAICVDSYDYVLVNMQIQNQKAFIYPLFIFAFRQVQRGWWTPNWKHVQLLFVFYSAFVKCHSFHVI